MNMKNLILSALFFLFFFNNVSFANSCKESLVSQLKNLLKTDHKLVLDHQLKLTVAKLAYETKSEKSSTLEQYFKKREQELASIDQSKIDELVKLYNRFGKKNDLIKAREKLKNASYWNKNLRLYNDDISAGVLLLSELETKSKMTETDVAIVWMSHKLSEAMAQKYGKNSAKHNLTNVSTRVAFMLDKIKDGKNLSLEQIKKQIESKENLLEDAMENLKKDFFALVPDECTKQELQHYCKDQNFQNLYTEVLSRVEEIILNDEIVVPALEAQLAEDIAAVNDEQVPNQNIEEKNDESLVPDSVDENIVATPEEEQLPWGEDISVSILEDAPLSEVLAVEAQINEMKSEELKIRTYEEEFHDRTYAIIDKSDSSLKVYNRNGNVVETVELELENIEQGDHLSDQTLGAGRYAVREETGNRLVLRAENGLAQTYKVKTPNGAQKAAYYLNDLNLGTLNTYVPPQSDDIEFVARDRELKLADMSTASREQSLNITPRDKTVSPISIDYRYEDILSAIRKAEPDKSEYVVDILAKRSISRVGEFAKAIEDEKETLMSLYDLDDDEYDQLALMAMGILAEESTFGEGQRYKIKELPVIGQMAISVLKSFNNDTSSNSRGLTQIKKLPQKVSDHYDMNVRVRGQTSRNGRTRPNLDLLKQPKYAAVSTMGFLAEALDQVKSQRNKNPNITLENQIQFVPIVFNTGKITATTTLDQSYAKSVKDYSHFFDLHRLSTREQIFANNTIIRN